MGIFSRKFVSLFRFRKVPNSVLNPWENSRLNVRVARLPNSYVYRSSPWGPRLHFYYQAARRNLIMGPNDVSSIKEHPSDLF